MTARIGSPKTGGRRKGSLDKNARQLITGEMAADLLAVYKKLGGVKWLLKFAEDNPAEFLRQGLSRLFPAPQKDDPDVVNNNTQVNFNHLDTLESARRVAFALNAGIHAQREQALEQEPVLIEVTGRTPAPEPEFSPRMWRPPTDAPDMPDPDLQPEPVEALDPDRQRWAAELSLTPEQRRDAAVVRETVERDISNYRGSSGEQPDTSPIQRHTERDPRSAQRNSMLAAHRRKKLL
ncbi:hypothetical protein [Pseudomonas sp.]|uniref:hypothetical protein n=1 Tax=Pseudomonas sp. TaxID=306 RepID=UPI0029B681CF|nr:hypothetical protein [Pseudomonas sp.]MDX3742426.1 hypothetical protein [Pseudomonas sp.]